MYTKKIKLNILAQYSIMMFIVIAIIVYIITIRLTGKATTNLIESHINIYPDTIKIIATRHTDLIDMFQNEEPDFNSDTTPQFVFDFLEFEHIFKVKIWSNNSRVLWSNDSTIIGEYFPTNDLLKIATKGDVAYSIEDSSYDDNSSYSGEEIYLEIYTPVEIDGKVIGVIELYESYDSIKSSVSDIYYSIVLIITLAGITLYLLLFSIFYKAYSRLRTSNHQLEKTKEVTLFALANLAEQRDNETGTHLIRTSKYIEILAKELKKRKEYKKYLTKRYIEDLVKSAPLHDIGKVGIKDSVLLKKGKLTYEEFEEMKKHCEIGWKTIESAEERLDFTSFLTIAKQITHYHHEWWNGTGYPEGLKENDIPLSARLMSLADVYDALRSVRPYKKAFTHEHAKSIIIDHKGTHFDPDIVDAFLKSELSFESIYETVYENQS